MATAQATALILQAATVQPGGTMQSPHASGVGQAVPLSGHHGGVALVRFANGSTGPTSNPAATIYGSHDGNEWTEIGTVYGDMVSGGAPRGQQVFIDASIPYVKGNAWGNLGQAVEVNIRVFYITGVT